MPSSVGTVPIKNVDTPSHLMVCVDWTLKTLNYKETRVTRLFFALMTALHIALGFAIGVLEWFSSSAENSLCGPSPNSSQLGQMIVKSSNTAPQESSLVWWALHSLDVHRM